MGARDILIVCACCDSSGCRVRAAAASAQNKGRHKVVSPPETGGGTKREDAWRLVSGLCWFGADGGASQSFLFY